MGINRPVSLKTVRTPVYNLSGRIFGKTARVKRRRLHLSQNMAPECGRDSAVDA